MSYAKINGTGSYLPEKILTNIDLEQQLDTSDEWIFSRTGIKARHVASDDETTATMAEKAAEKALENSTINAEDIDLIIVATCTPCHFFPSIACHVQKSLGIKRAIPAFDLGAACSGFVYAMDVANQFIKAKTYKNILVVGSETMSRAVDWTDRSTCVLFGDGAGAMILSASEKPGILGSVLHSAYDEENLLKYAADTHPVLKDSKISMRGNEVFKLAVNIMGDIVDEVLKACDLAKEDINWLVPHQANIRIIQAIARKLSLPMSQVVVTIENQGNTSAASIPIALDDAIKNNTIVRGDKVLLESFGGGMTWGAMVVEY